MANTLTELLEQLPGLEKATQGACEWLIDVAQVKTEQIEPASNPRGLRHEYWKGAFRGEYKVATQQWDVFCPVWHGGQAVKALGLAYQVTNDERYLSAAELGSQFIMRNQIDTGEDAGLILAYEDIADQVNTAAVLECLDGLFYMGQLTSDQQYDMCAIHALRWCRDKMWVKGEGLVVDRYDPSTKQLVMVREVSKDRGPGRPLVDDAVWLTGYQRISEQSFRDVFYEILERLLRDERPAGNWVDYGPCRTETGEMHPRHAYWWAKPMLSAWADSGDQRWLDCAKRSGQWYAQAQRIDGGLFRFTDLQFNTACFGHATSGVMCAALLWLELFKHTSETKWLEPIRKALDYGMSVQFVNPTDPNLKGCILEKVMPPDGTDANPYHIRDLGTIFFAQAAAALMLAAGEEGG